MPYLPLKRYLVVTGIIAVSLVLISGCWSQKEINELTIVMGIGIDQAAAKPQNIKVTLQVGSTTGAPSSKSRSGGGVTPAQFWNLKKEGQEILPTLQSFAYEVENRLYYHHNQVIIFGNQFCRYGLKKQLDFFIRRPEIRPTVQILAAAEAASAVLYATPQKNPASVNYLMNLLEAQGEDSEIYPVNLSQFLSRMINKSAATFCPMIKVGRNKQGFALSGTAVFKKDKMVGVLTPQQTRGLLWVIGGVKRTIIPLVTPSHGKINIEIQRATRKVDFVFGNNQPIVKIKIWTEGVIASQTGTDDLNSIAVMTKIEQRQSLMIKKEIRQTLKLAQKLRTDIFGFGTLLYQTHQNEWRKLEPHWDSLFSGIKVRITVESKIRRSGAIVNPML